MPKQVLGRNVLLFPGGALAMERGCFFFCLLSSAREVDDTHIMLILGALIIVPLRLCWGPVTSRP